MREMLSIGLIMCVIFNAINGDTTMKISGDFIIGALFRLHGASDPLDESPKCERIRGIHGMQRLEAAILALELINENTKILPGVTLGMEVHDICSSEGAALRESLALVREGIIQNSWIGCQAEKLYMKNSTLIGVIGPDTSARTIQVQNLLKLFRIPQIGYNSNTPELDDKTKYWSYLRIRPSDTSRSEVIRDILKKFIWTYVATVTSNDIENGRLRDSFRNLVEPGCDCCGICIAKDLDVRRHSNERTFDEIINEIDGVASVRVVICFCNTEVLHGMFDAMKRLNLTDRFTLIVSDYWADFDVVPKEEKEQAWGSISVNIHSKSIPSFSKYYTSLKAAVNTRNPIFNKFWEENFNCTLPIRSTNMKEVDTNEIIDQSTITDSTKFCTGNESLADTYLEYRGIGFVMKAVWALAHGLHSMMTEICGVDYTGICPNMYPVNTSKLITHLMKLSYHFNDELVTIDNGNSVPRYDILNLQKLPNNTFALVNIGNWTNGTLEFHGKFQSRKNQNVTSICSLPCPLGHRKILEFHDKNQGCCWKCEPCKQYDYISSNEQKCVECPKGQRPNANRTGCDVIPVSEHDWSEPLAIMIITFSVLGLIGTLYTLCIFIRYKDTPVVKASSRELCYVILFGMLLAHSTVFIVLAPRSSFQCALTRSVPGISAVAMFAGMFTKTFRVARILGYKKNEFPRKKLRFMSTSAQVAITIFCIAIEIAICFAMLIISPPEPSVSFWTRDKPIHACLSMPVTAIPPALFIGVCQGLCIIYGIKTRNVPGKFNESKFIGFAMLISFIICTFMIATYGDAPFRSHIVAAGMNFNALVILIFLFLPKLYIIVLRPEENNRTLFITTKLIRTHIGPRVNANVVESQLEHQIENSPHGIYTIAGSGCRLRKNVGIQTDLKLLSDISSSLRDDDGESINGDEVDPQHDNERSSSESDEKIITTIQDNNNRIISSRNSTS